MSCTVEMVLSSEFAHRASGGCHVPHERKAALFASWGRGLGPRDPASLDFDGHTGVKRRGYLYT
jgi:hypothetical protein